VSARSVMSAVRAPPTGVEPVHVQITSPEVAPTSGDETVPPSAVADSKAIPAGIVDVTATLTASLGPRFVAVTVYVTVSPAFTVSGSAVVASDRFAEAPTAVAVAAVLFAGIASADAEAIVAEAATDEPSATPGRTFTTSGNEAVAPAASSGLVHVTPPAPPGAGEAQLQPGGAATDAKVVPAGVAVDTDTITASLGPPLMTFMP